MVSHTSSVYNCRRFLYPPGNSGMLTFKRGLTHGKMTRGTEEKKLQIKSSQLHTLELWITPLQHKSSWFINRTMAGLNLFLIVYQFSVNELLGKWHWLHSLHHCLSLTQCSLPVQSSPAIRIHQVPGFGWQRTPICFLLCSLTQISLSILTLAFHGAIRVCIRFL